LTNTANTATASAIGHSGLGRGLNISLSNASNGDVGMAIFHSGTTGTGGYISLTDAAADRNSLGLIINYGGTGGGAGGGGNALEIQHYGSNGNAVDLFMGDPSLAAGPANTVSEYTGLTVSHMATGASPTAGLSKSAISASNYSADPTILAYNNGTEGGHGVLAQCVPGAAGMNPRGFYGYSYDGANTGLGYGGFFYGGWRGLYASVAAGGSGYGVYAGGDIGCTGPKTFLIDHPLDPENKELRHYCIESNEVLNMYRGIATLDVNGNAIVHLPDYFDAVNKNVTYQLTAIGTPTQPYIATEESNNEFTISGAPNTKVSWTVHAQRNDATLQYYDALGRNYSNAEPEKPAQLKGKYHVPEVYGKDQTFAIDPVNTNLHEENKAHAKNQKAMSTKEIKNSKVTQEKKSKEQRITSNEKDAPQKAKTAEDVSGR